MPRIILTSYRGNPISVDINQIKAMRRPRNDFMTVISSNFSFTDVLEVRETIEAIEDLINKAEGQENAK